MKVIIINPPAYNHKDYIREGRCMQTKSSWASLWMPLSLAYLAAVLRKENHKICLLDCIAEKMNPEDLIKKIKNLLPELAIINTAFPSIKGDLKIVQLIKKIFPDIKRVIIGMYPTLLGKKVLEKFKEVDYAVIGEPEWVIKELVRALASKESLTKIKGLIYREGKEIRTNLPQDLSVNNLEELPCPARDLLNNDAYRLPTTREKFTLLNIGRGCPYNCIYCTANIYYGKKFRKRSIASVVGEIEECVKKYNIKNFLFWGESFTTDPLYGEAICEAIIKKGLRIIWSCASRVDTLNEKLLTKMKEAGCALLSLGIESFNQEVLDRAKKNTDLAKIKKAIALVKKSGLNSMGHFIFGLPGDTNKTAQATISFACRSDLNYAQFYCAIPYPKTELAEIAHQNQWLKTSDFSSFDLSESVMRNENLSSREIKKLRDKAYRKFYFRPKMFIQAIKEINSLKSILYILDFLNWIKPKKD